MKKKIPVMIFLCVLLFVAPPVFSEEMFFEINAKKFSYTPNIIRVNKGDNVTIRLISEDVTHGFYLDAYGVEMRAHPGQDGSISFIADKTGRFTFRCSVTCGEFHPFMVGYLVIGPNIRFYLFLLIVGIIAAGSLAAAYMKKKR